MADNQQPNTNLPILKLNGVSKYFKKKGTFFKAVNNVSFDVNPGDFFGIIGESGSGKSTTGKTIIRLLGADGGTVLFDNNLISEKKLTKRKTRWLTQNMQMIFQDPLSSLNPRKNVLNLIAEPLQINKTLKGVANRIIKDHLKINDYFQYKYRELDYLRGEKFIEEYYKPLIEIYERAIPLVKDFKFDLTDGFQDGLSELTDLLASVDSEAQKVNHKIYDYVKDIKRVFVECLHKHENKDIPKPEYDYYEAKELAKSLKPASHHSRTYLNLKQQKEELEQRIEDFKVQYEEDYTKQAKTFLNSIRLSHKNEYHAIKQQMTMIAHYSSYLYAKAQSLVAKLAWLAFDHLKDSEYLTVQEIETVNKNVKEIAELLIKPLMDDVLLLKQKEGEKETYLNDLVQKGIIQSYQKTLIDEKDPLNSVAENYVSNEKLQQAVELQKQLIVEQFNSQWPEYDALVDALAAQLNKTETQFVELNKLTLNDVPGLFSVVRHAKDLSEKRELTYNTELAKFEKELAQLNQDLNVATNEQPAEADKQAYLAALEKERTLKQAFDVYAQEAIAEVNRTVTPKIEAHKKEVQALKAKLASLRRQYFGVIRQHLNRSFKIAWKATKDSKPLNRLSDWKQLLLQYRREVGVKINNQAALKFEFETNLEEIRLFRTLRKRNKLWLYLNRGALIKILTRERVYKALNEVGLKNEHAYRYPHEFSGGQRQRIVIARALISNPKLIIADEPISALDVSIQAQIINIMRKLAKEKGITFLFIAHDLSMVNYACNRMIIMHNGTIVEKGNTNEIFKNPIHPYTHSLIKAAPQLSKIHVDLASFSQLENYTASYSVLNKPEYHAIENQQEHFVLSTKEQLDRWQKKTH